MLIYFTLVLSPMITSFTPAPQLLLEVNESGSLVCNALGGPRLVITIERDGSVFENGTMGDDIVEYNFMANNETFGNYTCTAMIDDMEMNESTLVVGMSTCLIFSSVCICMYVCACVCACVPAYVCVCVSVSLSQCLTGSASLYLA